METNDSIMHAKLSELYPNPFQPESRLKIKDEVAKEFGLSILEKGLLQIPICRIVEKENKIIQIQMVDGWLRRAGFAWLVANGHPEYNMMPITLRTFTDEQMADMIYVANKERKDLTPIDLAHYYKKRLAEFKNVTQEQLGKALGISQGEIANTIRLLDLPEEVQKMIISREITESHGRALLVLKEKKDIINYAGRVVIQSMSVATLEAELKIYTGKQKPKLVEAPPPPEPAKGLPCNDCPNNVTCDRSKFTTDGQGGYHCDEKYKTLYLASRAKTEEPDEEQTEEEAEEKETKPVQKHGQTKTSPSPPKKEPSKSASQKPEPAKPAAQPTQSVKPTWQRKLVLEETGNIVRVSVMAEGKFPVMKGFNGNLEAVIKELPAFLIETNDRWSGKEVK